MRKKYAPSLRPAAFAGLVAFAALATALAAPAAATAQTVGQAMGPEALGFKKSFVVEIRNPSPIALENHPVVIDVAAIRAAVAWDFNTYMFALFEAKGGEYSLVVSQADDLDKDRYHDEIVIVRTLPAVVDDAARLLLDARAQPAEAHHRREGLRPRAPGSSNGPEAGWESNLAAFKLIRGRIEFYGKLQPGLILKKLPAPETKPQDWGMDVLDAGESAGLGGLVLWDGAARRPLFGAAVPRPALKILAAGPLRCVVKAEYPAVRTGRGRGGPDRPLLDLRRVTPSPGRTSSSPSKPAGPVRRRPGPPEAPRRDCHARQGQGLPGRLGPGRGEGRRGRAGRDLPARGLHRDRRDGRRPRRQARRPARREAHLLAGRRLGARRHGARRPGREELARARSKSWPPVCSSP